MEIFSQSEGKGSLARGLKDVITNYTTGAHAYEERANSATIPPFLDPSIIVTEERSVTM